MFELVYPWALALIPLPLLIWLIVPRAKVSQPSALKIPFFQAMAKIIEQEKRTFRAQSSLIIPAIIYVLLVIGLAGPRWVGEPKPITRDGYNIMLALDLSASMEIPDMMLYGRPASRLQVVKRAAKQFVQDRSGDRIGLILFGTRAYLQTPFTYDRHAVIDRIDDATAGLAGKTTSIGDALGLAVKRMREVPKQGRVIILLTDGANNTGVLEPMKAAELAKDEGIKVYTIGLGAEPDPRAMSGNFYQMNVTADLDEKTLNKIAKLTGGRYFRATDTQSLHAIYKTIHKLETVSQEQATIRPQKDYYPWCVGLALFLFLFWLAGKRLLFYKLRFKMHAPEELTT